MAKKTEIPGAKYNYLIVIDEYKGDKATRAALWNCKCVCGKIVVKSGWSLRTGESQSCGCMMRKAVSERFKKHGHTVGYSPEYRAWHHMKERCYNPKNKRYSDYGGRGIAVCNEWVGSFEVFLKDMGPRPSSDYSLDRFPNNDGNYEPSNCRWATRVQQMNSRRNTVYIEYDGERHTITSLSQKLNKTREWVRYNYVRKIKTT